MKLSIIVPAYNEEDRIGGMLEAYLAHFAALYHDQVEIIVSVNGSKDRTEAVVRQFQTRFTQLRMRVTPEPIGKGGAIMVGGAGSRRSHWICGCRRRHAAVRIRRPCEPDW